MYLYVASVGDGLCMAINVNFAVTQIDCGAHGNGKMAFNGLERISRILAKPEVFILSHFHVDHYNGLAYAANNSCNDYPTSMIKEVYYPRIPRFEHDVKFMSYLFTMNLMLLGEETGVTQYDLVNIMNGISHPLAFKPVSEGEVIRVNGSVFKVLWPPKNVKNGKTPAPVQRAIEDFEKARAVDDILDKLCRLVEEAGVFWNYLSQPYERPDTAGSKPSHEQDREYSYRRGHLPEVVEQANRSLRRAANYLGLALYKEDDGFLFLGDLEGLVLQEVIEMLRATGRRNFHILITPHHGTHWSNALEHIRCTYSITSNGAKTYRNMKPSFRAISALSLNTYINGDIALPLCPLGKGFCCIMPYRWTLFAKSL